MSSLVPLHLCWWYCCSTLSVVQVFLQLLPSALTPMVPEALTDTASNVQDHKSIRSHAPAAVLQSRLPHLASSFRRSFCTLPSPTQAFPGAANFSWGPCSTSLPLQSCARGSSEWPAVHCCTSTNEPTPRQLGRSSSRTSASRKPLEQGAAARMPAEEHKSCWTGQGVDAEMASCASKLRKAHWQPHFRLPEL